MKKEQGLYFSVSRKATRIIIALFLFTILAQTFILILEIKFAAQDRFHILMEQVSNIATINSQMGDLISLQRDLEAISSPMSSSLPYAVTIVRPTDQKLLVDTKSDQFDLKTPFQFHALTRMIAHPYGEMVLSASFDYSKLFYLMVIKNVLTCLVFGVALLIAHLYSRRIHQMNLIPLDNISRWLNELTPQLIRRETIQFPEGSEHSFFQSGLKILVGQLNHLTEKMAKTEVDRQLAEVAGQVSHDIRSPLSALNLVVGSLGSLPEESRQLVRNATQRINDIANNLLTLSKKNLLTQNDSMGSEIRLGEPVLLMGIIEAIVSEKRVQLSESSPIQLRSDLSRGFGLFSSIDESDFSRVLANIIQNSTEAINHWGLIEVILYQENLNAVVVVQDNGKGISSDILANLGQSRISRGKEGTASGTGLGIYHARQILEKFRGSLQIESCQGMGTRVTLNLPLVPNPEWFASEVKLSSKMQIVVVDDDENLHHLWLKRIQSLADDVFTGKIIYFSSLESFESWFQNSQNSNSSVIYLIDHEFSAQSETGLEIIEKLNLQHHSLLVTSRAHENSIQMKAISLKLKVLPKILVPLVPIVFQKPRIKYDAIVIDDDIEIIHSVWKMEADRNGKAILTLSDPDELFSQINKIDLTSPLFIDIHLAAGVRGQEIAYRAHSCGFININLATGFDPSTIKVPPFIRRVVGKDPIFDS